jgi:hypothetical protein
MHLNIAIPDDIAAQLAKSEGDLARRALEGFGLEEFKSGRITKVQLRTMLGLERIELDGFFKSHGVAEDYTLEDFEQERRALKELGM